MNETRAKRICIFLVLALALLFAAIFLARQGNDRADGAKGAEDMTAARLHEETAPSSTEGYAFRIAVEEDYLVVYKTTETQAYLYTDICTTSLPEEVLKAIGEGVTFKTEKELYDFLENYSS